MVRIRGDKRTMATSHGRLHSAALKNLPVTDISWKESREFIKKLNTLMKKNNLIEDEVVSVWPYEAEWEYACRAGADSTFGSYQNLDEIGWYYINSGQKLHQVGQKLPNAMGVLRHVRKRR